mgnify:CR=1 FL=1
MFCKNCGSKLDDDAIFCMNCGVKIADDSSSKYCFHCGNEIESDAVFCANCGSKIREAQKEPEEKNDAAPTSEKEEPVEAPEQNEGPVESSSPKEAVIKSESVFPPAHDEPPNAEATGEKKTQKMKEKSGIHIIDVMKEGNNYEESSEELSFWVTSRLL